MAEGELDARSGARTEAETPVIMYELNFETGELKWNDALYNTLHYARSEPFSRMEWWIEHIHPEDAMILNQAMDRLNDPSVPSWIVEYRFRSGDGNYLHMRDSASIVRDSTGRPLSLIGTLQPISTESRGIVA